VLDMRERGNVNEIVLAPGRQLDHKYSLMNETVCPVGALTSRDFRFKARVWFLKSAPGVCTGCATGCNTWNDFDPRNQRVYRIRPRDNEAVNKFWLCDDGMLSYQANTEGRVLLGRVASSAGGALRSVAAPEASLEAARLLGAAKKAGKAVAVVLSALHSTEDNWALAKLAKEALGATRLYLAARPGWDGDRILRHEDANPNRAGAVEAARAFGFDAPTGTAALLAEVQAGGVGAVLALGQVAEQDAAGLGPLSKVPTVVLAANEGPLTAVASVLVPVAAHAEMGGTFTNAKGMAQQWKRAIAPPPGVAPAWEAIADIASRMGISLGVKKLDDVRRALPAPQSATA
jgi:NADH-quinone oxidoreductase subunit G